MKIPILGMAGYSGSGKTTFLEKLIPILRKKGLRVAIVKHDGHQIDIDRPGKDSARFSEAGAEMVVLTSGEKTAVIEQRPLDLEQALRFVHDVDLVLVEGYKNAQITQIGIARRSSGKGFPAPLHRFWRIVTDLDIPDSPVPVYGMEDAAALAEEIMSRKQEFTSFETAGFITQRKLGRDNHV